MEVVFLSSNKEFLDSISRFISFIFCSDLISDKYTTCYVGDTKISFVPCSSVDEAVKVVDELAPSVIFLDHSLEKNDYEVIYRLRKIGIPMEIVVMTCNPDDIRKYAHRGIQKVIFEWDMTKLKNLIMDITYTS